MSNELATNEMFNNQKIELLKRTICRGASDDELELFMHACRRTGLDPFMKQIHAVKRRQANDQGEWVEVMAVQTGIDGYRLIADRTARYMPGREPTFTYDKDNYLQSATAYVKKQDAKGEWHEIAATAFWSEYVALKKDKTPTAMWRDKPHIMLSKCAEALALRRAFPAEMSGVYTREEMEQADVSNEPTTPPAGAKKFTPATAEEHDAAEVASNEQLKALDELLSKASDKAAAAKYVCTEAKVTKLEDLTANQADEWIEALKKKAAKAA